MMWATQQLAREVRADETRATRYKRPGGVTIGHGAGSIAKPGALRNRIPAALERMRERAWRKHLRVLRECMIGAAGCQELSSALLSPTIQCRH